MQLDIEMKMYNSQNKGMWNVIKLNLKDFIVICPEVFPYCHRL